MRATILIALLAACEPLGETLNENEVITTVVLTFTPASGSPLVFEWDDPDGDGGLLPEVDPVSLAPGDYTLTIGFENRLVMPAEDITQEIRDEAENHLVLFTGTAPLAQSYSDLDANGLPIGLANAVTATAGMGKLTVTLRHMPPEIPPVKAADTVELARQHGIDSLGGTTDASVEFTVIVQ